MKYNQTILDMMMRHPGIFPSEFHTQNHIFLCNGTGMEWVKGEIVQVFGRGKEKIERTKESIIGDKSINDERVCFYGAGKEFTPVCDWSEHVPLEQVLNGNVTPNPDWAKAINHFCWKLIEWTIPQYKRIITGWYEIGGYGEDAKKTMIKRDIADFKITRKKAVALRLKMTGHNADIPPTPEDLKAQNELSSRIIDEILAEERKEKEKKS